MEYKIRVDYAGVEVYEDTYNEGEGDYVNYWEVDVAGRTFNNVDELVAAVNKASYGVFSADKGDYVYIDGRIDTDAEVDVDNDTPSDEQYEEWKAGEIMLYVARLAIGVTMVPDGYDHEMTEEEAESFGLPVY